MRNHVIFALLFCLVVPNTDIQGRWIDRKAEGWAWYEEHEKVEQEEPEPPKPEKKPKQIMTEYQEKLEESRCLAIIEPTSENVEAYMRMQRFWINQASTFSSSWQKVLLEKPDLDPTTSEFPISHYGRQIKKNMDLEERRALIGTISQGHGLFFFFDGSIASEAFAKVVVKFSQRYNWEIIAVSVAGSSMKEFPGALPNNGVTEKFGATIFPSLFVLNPKNGGVYPIGYGMLSLDDLEKNMMLQFKKGENQ